MKYRVFKKICLILLLCGLNLPAQQVLMLTDTSENFHHITQIEHFCDTTDLLSIKDLSSGKFQTRFSQLNEFHISNNYQHANWFKITIDNYRNTTYESWILESWGFDMDNIEFYAHRDSSFEKISMGYTQKFNKREIFHKNPVFPLYLKQGRQVYFLKIQRHSPFHVFMILHTQKDFIEHLSYEYWYLGIFYGIFIFLATVAILIFITQREKLYLFYLFCVVSELLYCLRRDGLGFQFFWPDLPALNYILEFNIPQLLFVVASLFFSITFLELKERLPILYRACLAGIGIRVIIFIGIQFTTYQSNNIFVLDFVFLLLPFVSGIISIRNKHPYAGYYVVAYSCLFVSFILIILEDNKLLPLLPFNWYWINIGMLLEVLFLALALANHIRFLRRQKEEANQLLVENLNEKYSYQEKMNAELECKVKERTEEISLMLLQREEQNQKLKIANEELETLNNKVKEMNELLNQDNQKLRSDVTELGQSRVLLKDISFEEFTKFFPDDISCLKYLADFKWSGGYKCKKCEYNKGNPDEKRLGIRCKNCNYLESPTAGTLFHKLKFPITKAFYLMYLVYLKGTSISLNELSEILDMRRETCWSFRKKILNAQQEYSKKGINQSEHGWISIALESQSHE